MIKNLGEVGNFLQRIISRLEANQSLLKLLYYTGKDPLSEEDLTSVQIKEEIFEKLIKIIPRVGPKETAKSVIVVRLINGYLDEENYAFRNFNIVIEVFVPLTQWIIKDSNLRPYAIMGEIQRSLNGKIIDGIGKINGGNFTINFITDEISSFEMTYQVTGYD